MNSIHYDRPPLYRCFSLTFRRLLRAQSFVLLKELHADNTWRHFLVLGLAMKTAIVRLNLPCVMQVAFRFC